MPSILGGRSISVGRQWVNEWDENFPDWKLQFSDLIKLFEYIHSANSLVERDLFLVFGGNIIVRLFSELFSVSSEAIVFLVNPYY